MAVDRPTRVMLATVMAMALSAQPALKPAFVGTIVSANPAQNSFEIRPDDGAPAILKARTETIFQRVSPGERDLKNAQTAQANDIAAGDRVLINLFPGTQEIRRLVVMPATEITKRDGADRRDWTIHGISGVVVSKTSIAGFGPFGGSTTYNRKIDLQLRFTF
jgi:hypothetical protein